MATATAPRSSSANNSQQQAESHSQQGALDQAIAQTNELERRTDLALLKIENESICAQAEARPRNHKRILADIREQIEAYPSFAQAVVYIKPVGKDRATGKMQYARGLSIRAAEAIAEAYGYNRIRSEVSPVDKDTVKVEATFTDYQKGRIWQDAGLVSRFYTSSGGKTVRHNEDRFLNIVVKAEVSRRIREVILRSVPPGLRSELQELAEKETAKLLTDDAIAKIVEFFREKGIGLEQLERRIGRTLKAGWTVEDRQLLGGLWNAIESGETTVGEAFGDLRPTEEKPAAAAAAPSSKPSQQAGATADDLAKPKLASGPKEAAKQEQPAAESGEETAEPLKVPKGVQLEIDSCQTLEGLGERWTELEANWGHRSVWPQILEALNVRKQDIEADADAVQE